MTKYYTIELRAPCQIRIFIWDPYALKFFKYFARVIDHITNKQFSFVWKARSS